jgi:hypothetical protein
MVDDVYVEGDELLHDFDHRNDDAVLEIAPARSEQVSLAVPVSSAAVVALIAILLTLGAAAAKRLRQ